MQSRLRKTERKEGSEIDYNAEDFNDDSVSKNRFFHMVKEVRAAGSY